MSRHVRARKDELAEMSSLLGKALGRKEIFERLEANRITRQWADAVGEHLASKSSPEGFDHGKLTVAVTSAPWAQELRLRKSELLTRLNEVAGRDLFSELKFVVKNPKQRKGTSPLKSTYEPEEAGVEVSVPEIADVVQRAIGRLRTAAKRKK